MAGSTENPMEKVLRHLDTPGPDAAMACATLCMIMSQPQRGAMNLSGVADKVLKLITSPDHHIQRNASAAFSAAIENDDVFVQEAVQAGAAAQVVSLLDGCRDKGLILNLLNALGTLCEAGPEASASMTAAGGVEAVLPWCSAGQAAHLQLAAVDCLCKAAASSDEAKDVAAGKGAVAALAGLLGSGNAEVQVRSLLALGMLCGGGDNARQLQLATAPGAVDGLLVLMKQDADADCQQLAAALFTAMGKNPAVKDVLAAQTIQK